MATGLLVLCLGQATRLVEYLGGHDREYQGAIRLGATTTTDDAEGEVLERRRVPPLTGSALDRLERQFRGELLQRPPAYSAVKIGGRRAYALARSGEAPALSARPVRIDSLTLTVVDPQTIALAVACGPGTYVRSLARDIGEALGCGAHLAALRRTRAGTFDVDGALDLARVEVLAAAGELPAALYAPDEALLDRAAAILVRERADRLRQGVPIQVQMESAARPGLARVYDSGGEFAGVGELTPGGVIRPVKVFPRR
jgi:tRNA pseudouridine55 synthase